jgi:uncharacterized protein (TIGR03437 family)
LSATGLFAQNPTPNSVQNPASNILPGLPNYGIAKGSIFVVYGSNMGPSTLVSAPSLPLQTSLGGTSIQVTVAGTTVNALIVYTLKSQVAAVLPSNTPSGNGTLTVAYSGASGSTPIQVVDSNFGISTINQTGTGPAVVTFADYSVVTAVNSAKPGNTVIAWGTGLGPITGSDAGVPPGGNLPTAVRVFVGGVEASVTYHGRSASAGLDQVNFVIPTGVTGCYVSVVVQTGNIVSNTTTMAIASNGGACSDSNGLPLSSLSSAINNNSVRVGLVDLFQESINTTVLGNTVSTNVSAGTGIFEKYTVAQLTSSGSPFAQPSIGSCTVSTSVTTSSVSGSPSGPPPAGPVITGTGLDAGTAITITPPQGSASNLTTSAQSGKGFYSGNLSSIPTGAYTISNGAGGADVGAFSAKINVSGALQWANQATVTATPIDRTKPLQLTWTGGDPASYAFIEGISINSTLSGNTVTSTTGIFTCIAPIPPGQFTVSPSVLLSLPPANSQALVSIGILLLGSTSSPQQFSAPGLDIGFAFSGSASGGSVTYQ